jgi:hypothetical protein
LASTGVGSKQVGRRRSRTNQEMPTLHGYPKDPIPPSGITSTCSTPNRCDPITRLSGEGRDERPSPRVALWSRDASCSF